MKKVTAYQALDGSVFTDRNECKVHDAKLQTADFVKFSLPNFSEDRDLQELIEKTVADLLLSDPVEITKMLAPLVKAAKGDDADDEKDEKDEAGEGSGEGSGDTTTEAAPAPRRGGRRKAAEAPPTE